MATASMLIIFEMNFLYNFFEKVLP